MSDSEGETSAVELRPSAIKFLEWPWEGGKEGWPCSEKILRIMFKFGSYDAHELLFVTGRGIDGDFRVSKPRKSVPFALESEPRSMTVW